MKSYCPCETAFVECSFADCIFECLKPVPNMRNRTIRQQVAARWPYPEIDELDERRASVLFRQSSLRRVAFVKARFRGVWMDDTAVLQPTLRGCDFDGIQIEKRWWEDHDQEDPMVYYLKEVVLSLSEVRPGSPTVVRLGRIIDQLAETGSPTDWLGALEQDFLPEEDFDALDEITQRIPHP